MRYGSSSRLNKPCSLPLKHHGLPIFYLRRLFGLLIEMKSSIPDACVVKVFLGAWPQTSQLDNLAEVHAVRG